MNKTNNPVISNYDAAVECQVDRLRNNDLRSIEASVTAKRLKWLKRNYGRSKRDLVRTVSDAARVFLFEYLKLESSGIEFVECNENEISWRSMNKCPTLDACIALGLDTSEVCRNAYEKSTQAFFSYFDPQLRFLRDYREIRPGTPYCLERIEKVDFKAMMKVALEEATLSLEEGNKGYGAVAAFGNRIMARDHDTASTTQDPSQHAEFRVITKVSQMLGTSNLCGVVIYSTCEPCPMCSSLAVWANVTSIVYGSSIDETNQMGRSRITIPSREIVERSPVNIEMIGGVSADECNNFYEME